jgi:hypothetical protein
VSDGGAVGKGTGMGRKGRRRNRAGAKDAPARADASRSSTRTDDEVLGWPLRVGAEEGGAG